jgi:hypothetical protein
VFRYDKQGNLQQIAKGSPDKKWVKYEEKTKDKSGEMIIKSYLVNENNTNERQYLGGSKIEPPSKTIINTGGSGGGKGENTGEDFNDIDKVISKVGAGSGIYTGYDADKTHNSDIAYLKGWKRTAKTKYGMDDNTENDIIDGIKKQVSGYEGLSKENQTKLQNDYINKSKLAQGKKDALIRVMQIHTYLP